MTTAEKIADAEVKLHQLLTGQLARVFVDQNGERVEYTATNAKALRIYINELRAEDNTRPLGPLRMIF